MTASLVDHIRRLRQEPAAPDVLSLLDLSNEWAICASMAHLLDGLVRSLRPRSVLEFGAGRSSAVLASALQNCGGGRLTCVDHAPEFVAPFWSGMSRFSRVDFTLVHAGLIRRLSRHGLMYEFDGIADDFRSRGPFDFVFIDAPPGPLGRESTLFAAAPFLASGAVVVLDDAARPAERTAVRRWRRALDLECLHVDDVDRGVAVLRLEPGRPTFSMWTFVGTVHDCVVGRTGLRS